MPDCRPFSAPLIFQRKDLRPILPHKYTKSNTNLYTNTNTHAAPRIYQRTDMRPPLSLYLWEIITGLIFESQSFMKNTENQYTIDALA